MINIDKITVVGLVGLILYCVMLLALTLLVVTGGLS